MKTLRIYGPIFAGFGDMEAMGCTFAEDLANEILGTDDDLTINVNSPGGEIEGMVQIASALDTWSRNGHSLTVRVEGLAASAAAYLLLNLPEGAKVWGYANTAIMFHGASLLVQGGAGALTDAANYLRSQNEAFKAALLRTAIPEGMIDECLGDGRSLWLNGLQAMAYRVIDDLLPGIAPQITQEEPPKFRAVALFYPDKPRKEEETMKKKAKAEMDDLKKEVKEEVKEEIVEEKTEVPAPSEEEIKEEVKEEVKEEATEADCGEEEKPAADLQGAVAELTRRIGVLEAKLLETQAEAADEKAKVEALTGGLKAAVKPPEAAKPVTFSEAYAEFRRNHPEMTAGDAFVACAKANPELHQACIYEKRLF